MTQTNHHSSSNTTFGSTRNDSHLHALAKRARSSLCILMLSGIVMTGCRQVDLQDGMCANATIESTSDDANNVFESLSAAECDVYITEDEQLRIDLLDLSEDATIPRILFTLDFAGFDELPLNTDIDLSRANEVDLSPGIYQEYHELTQGGPFWSALSTNAGTIRFSTNLEGNTTAEFDFELNNPSSNGNTATGTLHITGTAEFDNLTGSAGMCGLGTATAAVASCLGLMLMGGGRRRIRRRR